MSLVNSLNTSSPLDFDGNRHAKTRSHWFQRKQINHWLSCIQVVMALVNRSYTLWVLTIDRDLCSAGLAGEEQKREVRAMY